MMAIPRLVRGVSVTVDQGEGVLGSVLIRDLVLLASTLDVVLNMTTDGQSEVTLRSRRRSFR